MGSIRRKKQERRVAKQVHFHKISVMVVSCVVLLMAAILSVASISLRKKNSEYQGREAKLEAQLEEELQRQKEIDALAEYVGTDAYVEDVAKEKLGLIYPNEILFEAVP